MTDLSDSGGEADRGSDFEAFFMANHQAIVALAASIGGRADAEDIAQEAMLTAREQWPMVAAHPNPAAWIRRVVINRSVSARRRSGARNRAVERLGRERQSSLPSPSALDEPIWMAVAGLPERQRAAVALHYLEDRPVAEIAEILGCARSTAKVHLHRGRRALAEALATDAGREAQAGPESDDIQHSVGAADLRDERSDDDRAR